MKALLLWILIVGNPTGSSPQVIGYFNRLEDCKKVGDAVNNSWNTKAQCIEGNFIFPATNSTGF